MMTKNQLRDAHIKTLESMPKEFKELNVSEYNILTVLNQEATAHLMLAAVEYLKSKLVESSSESIKSVGDTKRSGEGTGSELGKSAAKAGSGSSKTAGKGK